LLGDIHDDGLLPFRFFVICLLYLRCVFRVLVKILVVHGAQVVGVFALVLLDIGLIYPAQGVHEPDNVSDEEVISSRVDYIWSKVGVT
jgi:hypothetical protein